VGKDKREEEDTPRRPDDTNSHNKSEENGDQLALFHRSRKRVTGSDKG